jgi:hypothetical protein
MDALVTFSIMPNFGAPLRQSGGVFRRFPQFSI